MADELSDLRRQASDGDQDAIDQLVELAGERGDFESFADSLRPAAGTQSISSSSSPASGVTSTRFAGSLRLAAMLRRCWLNSSRTRPRIAEGPRAPGSPRLSEAPTDWDCVVW